MTYLYEVGGEIIRMHDDDCPCPICFFVPASSGSVILKPPIVFDTTDPDLPAKEVI